MSFRQIKVPTLKRTLSNVMAHPSSADPEAHERGLDEYRLHGGNCIQFHGEGGETHSRDATGRWLQERGLRSEFFLCTQICHDGWDESAGRGIDRFTSSAVSDDIAADPELLKTEYLDLVYLDDRPSARFEGIVEAIGRENRTRKGSRFWNQELERE